MGSSDERLFSLLAEAHARRGSEFSSRDLFRAFDGAADGHADLFVDRIGPFLLAHVLLPDATSGALVQALDRLAPAYAGLCGVEAMYVRVHSKNPNQTSSEGVRLLWGREVEEAAVREQGLTFLVRPASNVNAGIFLDTRELRSRLLATAGGARVLNTFCFTGSLGIAAACGGALETVQLDSSKRMLSWARENEALNRERISGRLRYVCEDCLTFLGRERKRLEQGKISPYDIVILDPPSFGRAEGKVFRLERDVDVLLEAAAALFGSEGVLYATMNVRTMPQEEFLARCRDVFRKSNIEVVNEEPVTAPLPDFPARGTDSIAMKGAIYRLARTMSS